MKKNLRKLILIAIASTSVVVTNAQQVSTFENLTLAPNSYWDGSAIPNGTTFTSGDATFPNYFKGYWSKGWAYSNKTDSTTAGYTNMHSARTGKGYNSDIYAVGQQNATIRLNSTVSGGKVGGMYVTNGTYAAISMRDGDGPNGFARRFGDTTKINSGKPHGDVKDWFKLTIKGYSNGSLKADSVEFYLADYRFDDNSKDYIVTTWKWVDLTSLGDVDSIIFKLNSSDVGSFGMNTPAYFCIDNFTPQGKISGIATTNSAALKMYPNPANDNLTIDLSALNKNELSTLDILDVSGRRVETISVNSSIVHLPVSDYAPGAYFISVKNANTVINAKFIKN